MGRQHVSIKDIPNRQSVILLPSHQSRFKIQGNHGNNRIQATTSRRLELTYDSDKEVTMLEYKLNLQIATHKSENMIALLLVPSLDTVGIVLLRSFLAFML